MRATATFTPSTHKDYDVLKGKEVFSADGEKVGSISQVYHPDMDMPAARGKHFFLLDPGMMKDWFGGFNQVYLPESSIDGVGSDRVSLSLTSQQIKQRGQEWTTEPTGLKGYRRV
ncbi:MAG: PRC-barrel domain-containing protein [Thermomicrobiales bacterium]